MMPGETILSGANDSTKDSRVSEFKVMHSPAGYYVGTTYTHDGDCPDCDWPCVTPGQKPWEEPNSRETDYLTGPGAEAALAHYKKNGVMPHVRL